jgi:hypothetical protein
MIPALLILALAMALTAPHPGRRPLPMIIDTPPDAPRAVTTAAADIADRHHRRCPHAVATYADPHTPGWRYTCRPVWRYGAHAPDTHVRAWEVDA